MTAIYNFTPDQREAIAKVESMRAMHEAKHQWRAHYRSMPAVAATTPARNPRARTQAAAAGAYINQEIAA